MSEPRTINLPGSLTDTQTYELAPGLLQYVQAVRVTIDNTGGADAHPNLSVSEQSGVVIADAPQNGTIPAGESDAASTWALRLLDDAAPTRTRPGNDNFPDAFPLLPVWDDNAGAYVFSGAEHGTNVNATQDSFWDPSPNDFGVSTGFFDASVWYQGVMPQGGTGYTTFNYSFTPTFSAYVAIFFPDGAVPPPIFNYPSSSFELWTFVDAPGPNTWLYTSQPVSANTTYTNLQTLATDTPFFFWIASSALSPNVFDYGTFDLVWSMT